MRTFTVYHYRRDLDNTLVCSLGCSHRVTYHETKRLTEAPDENYEKFIKALHYDKDGYGTVRVAYDYQGRRYEAEPTWEAYGPWVSLEVIDVTREPKVYWPRPILRMDVAFDLTGKIIK